MAGCSGKSSLPEIEQNPYRTILEYTPGTFTMEVPGTLTPDDNYDWITVSQSGNSATFTVRRNTGGIRRAEYSISGKSQKAVVNQKAHALDASLSSSLASQSPGTIGMNMVMSSKFMDDYDGWGIAYGESPDLESAKLVSQSGVPVSGTNTGSITGLKEGADYYVWTYVQSTEGDKIFSGMVAVKPPVYVRAGDDLQAALNGADEYAEVRVQGGTTFYGPFSFIDNKNKSISGGWNADFTEQSWDNLTVIDGQGKNRGFVCCASLNDEPMTGYANISYFEITNCNGDHGMAIHACGGPVTVSNCFIHDNTGEKGAIGTREEKYSTELNVINCIIKDNYSAGHGGAFCFGDGASYEDQCMIRIIGNLLIDNVSTKKDGYASVFICYNNSELIFVNNTVVGNKSYNEYGGPYPGTVLRGNVRSIFANNIYAGNYVSENVDPAEYYRQEQHLGFGGSCGTLVNNIIGGTVKDSGNAKFIDNIMVPASVDMSTIVDSNWKPVGAAVGGGTLGTVEYRESRDSSPKTLDIGALLNQYPVDINGNPRVKDGKVNIGCY